LETDSNRAGKDIADVHLKRQIMGREAVVAITNGKLDFGPWEQIFYSGSTAGGASGRWLKSSENKSSFCLIKQGLQPYHLGFGGL